MQDDRFVISDTVDYLALLPYTIRTQLNIRGSIPSWPTICRWKTLAALAHYFTNFANSITVLEPEAQADGSTLSDTSYIICRKSTGYDGPYKEFLTSFHDVINTLPSQSSIAPSGRVTKICQMLAEVGVQRLQIKRVPMEACPAALRPGGALGPLRSSAVSMIFRCDVPTLTSFARLMSGIPLLPEFYHKLLSTPAARQLPAGRWTEEMICLLPQEHHPALMFDIPWVRQHLAAPAEDLGPIPATDDMPPTIEAGDSSWTYELLDDLFPTEAPPPLPTDYIDAETMVWIQQVVNMDPELWARVPEADRPHLIYAVFRHQCPDIFPSRPGLSK